MTIERPSPGSLESCEDEGAYSKKSKRVGGKTVMYAKVEALVRTR